MRPFLFEVRPNFGVDPVNLTEQSPFTQFNESGLPPGPAPLGPVVFRGGVPYIGNTPLGNPARIQGAGTLASPPPIAPVGTYDRGNYGDAIVLALTFSGAGLGTINGTSVILARPNNTRVELLIVNSTVAGPIFYNFGQDADNIASVPIGIGGNRLWDTVVPQGNLSIFSSGAGVVIIEYINVDITA